MTAERYSRSAIALHWAIAILLLCQLGLGWHMAGMARGPTTYAAYQFHKSIGIMVLVLSAWRVGLRLFGRVPAPAASSVATGWIARLVHLGLYGFMIGGPLTGWAVVSTAAIAIPTRLFGILPWPHLPLDRAWHDLASDSHEVLAWIGLALIALHFAGAIRHHVGKGERENVIGRMIPAVSMSRAPGWALPAALGAAAVLGFSFMAPRLFFGAAASPGTALPAVAPSATRAPTQTPAVQAVQVRPEAASGEPAEGSLPPAATVEPPHWKLLDGGTLGFTATVNGAGINGRFEKWSADIQFDQDALPGSSITVRVPLLSAETGDAERDGMLQGPAFFGDAGKTAIFSSKNIQRAGGDRYTARGMLTMNGATRPVTLGFSLRIKGDSATVTGSTRLDRTGFGIGTGDWASTDQIAAHVDIAFHFSARRVK